MPSQNAQRLFPIFFYPKLVVGKKQKKDGGHRRKDFHEPFSGAVPHSDQGAGTGVSRKTFPHNTHPITAFTVGQLGAAVFPAIC